MGNPQVTERELVWLACFIDCEGSIQLVKTHGSKSAVALHARVQMPSTDSGLVYECYRILNKLGVNPYIHQHVSKSKNAAARGAYTLYFQRFGQIKRVLEAILPYLVSKAGQARLMLDYINRRTDGGKHSGKRKPITEEDLKYWEQMKRLNARGTPETIRTAPIDSG